MEVASLVSLLGNHNRAPSSGGSLVEGVESSDGVCAFVVCACGQDETPSANGAAGGEDASGGAS